MKRPFISPWCIAFAAIFLPIAHADDKDVIDYRQHIMNTLGEQAAALGEILSTVVPDDNAVAHINAIALTASTALKAFEPKVPGGQAKPTVWSNWPDFSKRMNELAQRTADAAKVAKEKGKDAALSNILDQLTCKSCHDVYRQEKKDSDQ
jgi:cytochrome c556